MGPAEGWASCLVSSRSRVSSRCVFGTKLLLEAILLPAVAGRAIELTALALDEDCAVPGRVDVGTALLGTRTAPEEEIVDLECRLLPSAVFNEDVPYPFLGGERFSLLPVNPARYMVPALCCRQPPTHQQ